MELLRFFFNFSFVILDVFLHISFPVSVWKKSAWDKKEQLLQRAEDEISDKQNKPLLEGDVILLELYVDGSSLTLMSGDFPGAGESFCFAQFSVRKLNLRLPFALKD